MPIVVEGAGVELSVHEHGPAGGVPVLLVHGLASDAAAWAQAAGDLASGGHRVLAYDRRGYGGSGAPEPYAATTVGEQAADALALLDALGAADAVLAGDGFGALVALDLALRHPARVRALVLVDPPLLLLVPDAAQELAQERARLEDALRAGGPGAAVAAWLDGRADNAALARAQASARGFFADYAGLASLAVTRAGLRAVRVPAVIATTSSSSPSVRAAAAALAELLPHARLQPDATLAAAVRAVSA